MPYSYGFVFEVKQLTHIDTLLGVLHDVIESLSGGVKVASITLAGLAKLII